MQQPMIAAGWVPGCPSAWHRGLYELVQRGVAADLPGIDRWPVQVWLALPIALVSIVALWAARTSRPRALVVTLALGGLAGVWVPAVLAPLLWAIRTWPSFARWQIALAIAVALASVAAVATPSCLVPDAAVMPAPGAAPSIRLALASVGTAGLILVAVHLIYGTRDRFTAASAAVAALALGFSMLSTRYEPASTLAPVASTLWWFAVAGGRQVVAWQTSWSARLAAAALVILAPLLVVVQTSRAAAAARGDVFETARVWTSLEQTRQPSAVLSEQSRVDLSAFSWRAGPGTRRGTIQLPSNPDVVSSALDVYSVYAWPRTADRLSRRGFLDAPIAAAEGTDAPVLRRVLAYRPCVALGLEWQDVTGLLEGGRFTGVFPIVAPLRGALVYVGAAAPLDPRPLDWPGEGGFEVRLFDRDVEAGRQALADAATRDVADLGRLGELRFVARVRFDRRRGAPDTLSASLGATVSVAHAKLYSPREEPDNRVQICRHSGGLLVAGYEEAPRELQFDLNSPFGVGAGWHPIEPSGDGSFRRTAAPESALLFIVHQPEPLSVRLEAESPLPVGDPDAAAALGTPVGNPVRVSLNGVPTTCEGPQPTCDWRLPMSAMREGLNVLTIHTRPGPAQSPGAPTVGTLVRSVTLRREK